MATKALKEMRIFTNGGETISVADTTTQTIVEPALDSFKKKDTMRFKSNGTEYRVPFHAVNSIAVFTTPTTVDDKPSPYGC